MENKDSLLKNSLTYGLITGFVSIIYTVVLYIMNQIFNQALGFLGLIILIVGIVYGTKVLRDKFENGVISYSRALGSGVLIALFAAILGAIFNYVLYTVIDPDLMEKSFQYVEERFLEKGRFSEEQIEAIMERTRARSNPLKNSIWAVVLGTLSGFIISLITSIFIKKEGNPVVEA